MKAAGLNDAPTQTLTRRGNAQQRSTGGILGSFGQLGKHIFFSKWGTDYTSWFLHINYIYIHTVHWEHPDIYIKGHSGLIALITIPYLNNETMKQFVLMTFHHNKVNTHARTYTVIPYINKTCACMSCLSTYICKSSWNMLITLANEEDHWRIQHWNQTCHQLKLG